MGLFSVRFCNIVKIAFYIRRTRVILPGEKALLVDRLNIKILNIPYTNKYK